MIKRIGILLLLLLPAALFAQSARSVVGGEAGLWAGGELSSFNPDWGCISNSPFRCGYNQLIGPTALFDFNARSRWGAEGEARWLHWHGVGGQTQADYLLGPRFRFFQFHRLNVWAKFEMGGGWITTPGYPNAIGSLQGSYFVYAPGGTLDYHLSHRLSLRGDYEYQKWPALNNNGLTPNGFSAGVAYRFLGN